MSLFQVERLTVALCPEQIGIVRRARRGGVQRELVSCFSSDEWGDWRPALSALAQWLEKTQVRRGLMTVVLSSRFVRFALMPWQNTFLKKDEELAWSRFQFETLYGDMRGWRLSPEPPRYGCTRVVCAVPEELLDNLQVLSSSHRLALGALTPHFVWAWNRWRRTLQPDQLFGVAESSGLVVGSCGAAGWQSLRVLRANASLAELAVAATRELTLQMRLQPLPPKIYVPGIYAAGEMDTHKSIQDATAEIEWLGLQEDREPPALAMARLAEHA